MLSRSRLLKNFFSSIKTVGTTVLGGLWALKWEWHPAEINLRCARSSGICIPNPNSLALIVFEISALIRTDKARSPWLVILIKSIYTLWGRKRFLLPFTYFTTNLVYPFTLRVTGIKIRNRPIYIWYLFISLHIFIGHQPDHRQPYLSHDELAYILWMGRINY